MPLPGNWALSSETFPPQPASFDPSGQLLALPLDRVDSSGNPSAQALFVIDLTTRTVRMIRGAQLPLPAGAGVIADTLIGSWNSRGLLWVLAMNPSTGNHQLGFWTDAAMHADGGEHAGWRGDWVVLDPANLKSALQEWTVV